MKRLQLAHMFCVLALVCGAAVAESHGAPLRALPMGTAPNDARLQPPKDFGGDFPFILPASPAEWEKRAAKVRQRILVALGLSPMPTPPALKPIVHGRIDCGDYTVEKVFFESAPGFFVTGNLYRPTKIAGKVPGVLVAHGHNRDNPSARMEERDDGIVRQEIGRQEERFENAARNRYQAMGVQLARMGCVALLWDMVGYDDSQQLSFSRTHRFSAQRPDTNTGAGWGLFSVQAETRLQSLMGLQTLNSIRALDFLLSLPEVDAARVAVTGPSGGGTQAMILAAIDPRVRLSFPIGMVGTAKQGTCTCENACLLRIDTGNVEVSALFAPKPQGFNTANDNTRDFWAKGFPELRTLYTMLGAADNVSLARGEHFAHNFNSVTRSAVCGFIDQHFLASRNAGAVEKDHHLLKRADLTVWNERYPAPKATGPDFERQLLRWWHDDAQEKLAAAAKDPTSFRQTFGPAWDIILNPRSDAGEMEWAPVAKVDRPGWSEVTGLLRNKTHLEELPMVIVRPTTSNGQTIVWLTVDGKAGLYAADGSPMVDLQRLLRAGFTLVGVDLIHQGEFRASGEPLARTPTVANRREVAAYTFGYNNSVFVQRVHDVLSVGKFIRESQHPEHRVNLVGIDGAGAWAAAAQAFAGAAFERIVIDTGGFRFGAVHDIHSPDFLPGGAKYGDLPALLALGATRNVWIAGESEATLGVVRAQVRAALPGAKVRGFAGQASETREAAITWLFD